MDSVGRMWRTLNTDAGSRAGSVEHPAQRTRRARAAAVSCLSQTVGIYRVTRACGVAVRGSASHVVATGPQQRGSSQQSAHHSRTQRRIRSAASACTYQTFFEFPGGCRPPLALQRAWHRDGKSCFTRIGLWRRCVTEWPRGHSRQKCKRCLCKRLRILMTPARRVLRTDAFARRLPRLELGSSHASFPSEPQCPFPTSRLVRPSF